jgi:hypothetical protein
MLTIMSFVQGRITNIRTNSDQPLIIAAKETKTEESLKKPRTRGGYDNSTSMGYLMFSIFQDTKVKGQIACIDKV